MKKSVKNLTIVGLSIYGVGILLNIWDTFIEAYSIFPSSLESSGTRYIINSIVITTASVLVNLIIAALVGFLAYRFLKKKQRKNAIHFSIASGVLMLLTGLTTAFQFTAAIPKYLIYSTLGLIDTYITYFMSFLENGVIFRFIALILIFIATMMFLFKKREEKNEIQQP